MRGFYGHNVQPSNYIYLLSNSILVELSHLGSLYAVLTQKIIYGMIVYLQAIYSKQVFKGIAINFLDYDDPFDTCGCGKFPVANMFIDAWEDISITPCPKIG